ncbi:hypothetical protein [Pedosphaera parvula]|uniref:Uncharacterized protein n=1 Tax=Pedosphaera parvula (strain Ellin514) TaxID=320771 RepID=B9XBM7_PEDPL|nr:hypothetical protein [Pedosphaera parvula]EEF62912.1 hypothetical protein Cflav_PD5547 [Pedosphaera parvula Ellin514]
MKKVYSLLPALAGLFVLSNAQAVSLDDVQLWTGTGTNRAAMVINWTSPEVHNNTSVPNPAAEKSLVWGYRWNGTATAENMFNAIVAGDHRLFVAASDPYPGFGPFIYAIGYDLNNNGVFGIRIGTNVFAENAFTNGLRVFTTEDADSAQSLDPGDLYWSGQYGANWEMWQEHGGTGGFTNAPDRGPNPYWTPLDTTYFSYGPHGQWDYTSGLELVTLHDGSWVGFTVSAGGLNYSDDSDPGTIAYDFHKHAPATPEAVSIVSSYAVQLVASQGPFGPSPYDDPTTVLGAPSTRFYESASKPATRVKLVEAVYSTAPDRTNKLIVTLNNGSSIIAKFNQPVYDNPVNPYGIDFLVFGNAFYSGGGFSSDAANMNTFTLGTGGFYEPTKVSVSPGFTGKPGEDANDPATWPWYRYDNGPYGDSDFPTQAYKWNRAGTNWTDEVMDFTKPVNPAMRASFSAGGLTAADGIDLYDGSGGGTGFDLKESGFTSIQYIKVEGISPGFSAGEIDAISIVRPMTLGDELTISPANLTNNTAQLFFQKAGNTVQNLLSVTFTSVSDIAKITTSRLDNPAALYPVAGNVMNAIQLVVSPVLGTTLASYQADVALSAGNYVGNGSDLRVFQWNGTNWTTQPFLFSPTNNAVVVQSVTNLSSFAVTQLIPPQLSIRPGTNGFVFQFTPIPNCPHVLERSTDFINWNPVTSFVATNAQPMMLEDHAAPVDKAFYRLRLNP